MYKLSFLSFVVTVQCATALGHENITAPSVPHLAGNPPVCSRLKQKRLSLTETV